MFCVFAVITIGLSLASLEANSGVFRGAGVSVIPQKQKHVRMAKEVIKIKIDIPEASEKWGVPFIPKASLDCLFHFENSATNVQSVLVGFPIILGEEMPKKRDNIVQQLNFSSQFNGVKNHVKYRKGLWDQKLDPKHLYKHVFTWTNSFPPQTQSQLAVKYAIELSPHALYGFMGSKSVGIGYVFPYVTSTAYTWQSTPQSAEFSIDVRECRKKVREFLKSKKQIIRDANPRNRPLIFWSSKTDFHYEKGIFRKTFASHELPKDTIEISLIILNLPSSVEAITEHITKMKKQILSGDVNVKQAIIMYFDRLASFYSELHKGQVDSSKLFDPYASDPSFEPEDPTLQKVYHFQGKKQKNTIFRIHKLITENEKFFHSLKNADH